MESNEIKNEIGWGEEWCSQCGGNGNCHACANPGNGACSDCAGTGIHPYPEACSRCSGSGKCHLCGGSGKCIYGPHKP